jgi:deoxycytidylate deaminase
MKIEAECMGDNMKKEHIERMRAAREKAWVVPCVRTKFVAMFVIPGVKNIFGYNHGPLPGGLCGGDHCPRRRMKIPQGEQLEISCIHAEVDAAFKLVHWAAESRIQIPPFYLYLWGSNGASLPCVNCFKHLLELGCKGIYIAGEGDEEYVYDTPIPDVWLREIPWEFISVRRLNK